MPADDVRATLQAYVEALLARSDFAVFFDDDVRIELVGTDQRARGPKEAEALIRHFHEVAFDARPEVTNVLVDDHGAAAEAFFVGTHTGEFGGLAPTGRAVRVAYCAFYDISGGRIRSARLYMPIDELVGQLEGTSHAASAPATA